jgi:hypothetical protein
MSGNLVKSNDQCCWTRAMLVLSSGEGEPSYLPPVRPGHGAQPVLSGGATGGLVTRLTSSRTWRCMRPCGPPCSPPTVSWT